MTTKSATGNDDEMPVGREEVSAAILAAAAELFADRGPAATSIREIAARAKVNHGLVFRHFGTKEQLVGAVLDNLGVSLTALLAAEAPIEEVEPALDRPMRVMARALLDGYPVGQLQTRFPAAEHMLDQQRHRHDTDRGARLAVANAVALQLGWRLFEPFLRSATGIEQLTGADLRQEIGTAVARISEPPARD